MVSYYIIECDFKSSPSLHPYFIESEDDIQIFLERKDFPELSICFADEAFKSILQNFLNKNSDNEYLVIRITE